MGAAYFYHLTQTSLDVTLPRLLEKARGAGWKIAVRGTDPGRMEWLDQKLWLQGDESFLAHGQAGGAHDALQPILLTTTSENTNQADILLLTHQAKTDPSEVAAYKRVCLMFDGNNANELTQARTDWKSLTEAGIAAQYWAQEDGRWTKKAEKKA